MAITYQSAGAISYSGTPAYPSSLVSGDLLILLVGSKSGTVNTPRGWLLLGSFAGTTGSPGPDTGPTVIQAYAKAVDGVESLTGNLSVTGTWNVAWHQIFRISNDTGFWGIASATGQDAAGGTSWSATLSSDPGLTSGDMCLVGSTDPTDVAHTYSASAITATGVTFGASTLLTEPRSSSGNDIGGFIFRQSATAGTSSAAPVVSATVSGTTTNVYGPSMLIRLREVTEGGQPTNTATLAGVYVDVANSADGQARLAGVVTEVATRSESEARLSGVMLEVMTPRNKISYPTGIASGESFGLPAIANALPQDVVLNGVASGEAFGSPTLSSQASISVTGITSDEAFGLPVATSVAYISTTGVAPGEVFGSPELSAQASIFVTGLGTGETFGSPVVTNQAVFTLVGIASSENFGSPSVSSLSEIQPTGLASAEQFGSPSLLAVAQIQVSGVASGESFGSPTLISGNGIILDGVASGEAFGSPALASVAAISISGIGSEESFGSPALTSAAVAFISSIGPEEAFGLPSLQGETASSTIGVLGIGSVEAFGSPSIDNRLAIVSLLSVLSEEAFGLLSLAIPGTLTPDVVMKVEFDVILVDVNSVLVDSTIVETAAKRATIREVTYTAT